MKSVNRYHSIHLCWEITCSHARSNILSLISLCFLFLYFFILVVTLIHPLTVTYTHPHTHTYSQTPFGHSSCVCACLLRCDGTAAATRPRAPFRGALRSRPGLPPLLPFLCLIHKSNSTYIISSNLQRFLSILK